jgi:hypothetical protein
MSFVASPADHLIDNAMVIALGIVTEQREHKAVLTASRPPALQPARKKTGMTSLRKLGVSSALHKLQQVNRNKKTESRILIVFYGMNESRDRIRRIGFRYVPNSSASS